MSEHDGRERQGLVFGKNLKNKGVRGVSCHSGCSSRAFIKDKLVFCKFSRRMNTSICLTLHHHDPSELRALFIWTVVEFTCSLPAPHPCITLYH